MATIEIHDAGHVSVHALDEVQLAFLDQVVLEDEDGNLQGLTRAEAAAWAVEAGARGMGRRGRARWAGRVVAQSLIVHIESPVGFAEIRASPDRTVALLLDAAIKNLRLIGFQDGDVCELWRYGKQLTPSRYHRRRWHQRR